MAYKITLRAKDDEPVYTPSVAAQLARISLDFLRLCEEAQLARAGLMTGGGPGYSAADIRHLARIRRLHQDLGLDLEAIEITLRLRRRIVDLMIQMDEMEKRMARREQELLNEIQYLRRRLSEEGKWRW